jgi:hypothetical protein
LKHEISVTDSINNLVEVKESFYIQGIYSDLDSVVNQIENGIGLIEKLAQILQDFVPEINLNIKHNDRDGYYLNTTKIRGEKLEVELKKQKKTIKLGNKEILPQELVFTYQTNTCKITYSGLSDHSDEIENLYAELNIKIKDYFYSDTTEWFNTNPR